MDDKKVMGHNPLENNHLEGAKFNFIPFTESGALHKSKSKIKSKKKKVVSYYLEEELISEIRLKATQSEETFSKFVEKILKQAVTKNN